MGKSLGGIRLERNLIHDMQLMVMLSNAKLCWRDLSQPHRDESSIRMPWCAGVIWSITSSIEKHPSAWVCQVISGKLILLCLLLALSVQPPNQGVQSTPLRGRKIAAILTAGFVSKVVSIYWCGAADAQHVGRRVIKSMPAKGLV